ncbi:lytic transglycosylase domain-containing protein [Phenylobacterium deserti]|uniref:Lytic transglycosylase domain-containing protein n=1 Tax=Phenylobacterium deserti TaxID=1914756 RepID=A0A328AC00_9CAUL|nr:lytic transglycosylase domain-containing protein [Phenylobacterium deserti]
MFCRSKTAITTLGACLLLSPGLACADVIQTGSNGFSWVAGGPAEPSAEPAQSPTAEPAYTQAASEAGPAVWRAQVSALAAKYDISPALLEAVVWQESRWRQAATSRAGAHGLAQLMPGTARDLGVDRADPMANLEGGARYLRMQLDLFGGDVEKALAAYNAGPARVRRAGGVPQIPETQAYVAAIMARLTDRVRR